LIENRKYDRAVPLLIGSKQFDKALDIISTHNVPLQDEYIKKILPDDEPTTPQ